MTRPFHRNALVLAVAALATVATPARPCTTFQATTESGARLYGRNLDYPIGVGFLSVNARGVSREAFLGPGAPWQPARWTAAHGSVTFSQFGRELPYGGMNERGLVVEVMVLSSSIYPETSFTTPTVSEAGLVQYLLDTQDTAAGAVAAAESLAVESLLVPLHYLVCDAAGACATLEYVDGALTVHDGAALPVPGLANDTYADSLAYLSRHQGFGGTRPIPRDASSLARFVRMAAGVRAFVGGADPVAAAYRLLDDVRQPGPMLTHWQFVYDQTARKVHFRTHALPTVTTVALDDLDFSCDAPRLALDLDGAVVSPARRWFQDDATHRLALSRRTLRGLGVTLPDALVEAGAAHGDAQRCAP